MSFLWFEAEKGDVHSKVVDYVQSVESVQWDVFDRFVKCAALYDPNDRQAFRAGWWTQGSSPWAGPDGQVYENVCASNVDTVTAIIAPNKPRARFMTDDGDWSTQRRAKLLELYAEGLVRKFDVYAKTQRAFKDAAIKGTGLIKVHHDGKRLCVERVPVDEIVVDEGECLSGQPPRQLHHRKIVNRQSLKARYPKFAEEIDQAGTKGGSFSRMWADYRPIEDTQVAVIESWYLPIGDPDDDDFIPGRWVLCVEGCDIFDEEWRKPFFPFGKIIWSERSSGYYGIGLIERIAGHQRVVNKRHWQIDLQIDRFAVPVTYTHQSDAALAVKSITRVGTQVVYKHTPPIVSMPQSVSPETFRHLDSTKAGAYEESGVSRLTATAMKPAGIDSGVAMREYRDATTQRFAIQEQAYEQFFLDVVWLMLDAAKDLGKEAPEIFRKGTGGGKKIKWPQVDMGEVRIQIAAAAQLSRTPAGRIQLAMELAQNGIISPDSFRRMLQHPDLESEMSLYVAALEDIERCIEEILDGEVLVPEPYQNLQMGVWRGQHHYLKARADGAPEETLENLRQFIVQCAHVLSKKPAEMPMGAPPVEAQAAAALAPSAAVPVGP